MLPSLGFNEIVVLGILALIVVGPKDLPLLLRKFGRWTAKLRGMAQEFRTGFDELARQAELDELKREVDALRRTTSLQEIKSELAKPLPTLEDYAGVKSPSATPAPVEAPAFEDAPQSGGESARSAATDEPPGEESSTASKTPSQQSIRSDSPSIEGERGVPEHADVAPIARSAP